MPKVEQEFLIAFGQAVCAARIAKGWTSTDLDEAIQGGIDKSHLSAIENGRRKGLSPVTVSRLTRALDLEENWLEPFMVPGGRLKADERAESVVEKTIHSDEFRAMKEAGITERAIIELAQNIAFETGDVGQAWLELQNAMDVAVQVQADGRVTSNHGDFVDEVLKRVAALSAEGDYASAGEEIDAALSREEEESQARKGKLLGRGVEVALLDRDTKRAAELLVRRVDLEAGGVAGFEDLRAVQNFYYERGRDKGINLDLELAIDLAELIKVRADGWNELGNALNDLGMTLGTLGERESGTVRLEEAVKTSEAALEEWTREKVPLDWARTQNNFGNALLALGARESGTTRLEEAVEAYEAALEERIRDRVPLDWAITQGNLANVEIAFFDKTGAVDHLDRAEAYADAAREVFLDGGAEHYVGIADEHIAAIQERRGGI